MAFVKKKKKKSFSLKHLRRVELKGLMGDVESVQGGGGDVGRTLPLLVILVFGAVFEDAGELCVVEVALLVDGRLAEQLVHLLVREAVSHGGQQLPQVVLVDHT